MSGAYGEYMEERRRKEEALLDVPKQVESLQAVPDKIESAIERLDDITDTLSETLRRFEPASLCDIFLSHKSIDKELVIRIKNVLDASGFAPWIDEERMTAGTALDRAILDGMKGSCAAVFFITRNFADNRFLAQEVDYAVQVQRDRPSSFVIIPILYGGAPDSVVPDLLRRFVIKTAETEIDVLLHILKALPIRLGPPIERQTANAE